MFILLIGVQITHRLLGTLWRKAKLLSTYSFYLGWSIGVQLVIDGIYLYAFFSQSRQSLIDRCIGGSTDSDIRHICEQSFNTNRWSLIVGMVIGLIIQLCECLFCFPPPLVLAPLRRLLTWIFLKGAAYIVTSYANKLKEQKAWRSGPGIVPPMNASGPKYVHVGRDEESHIPLTGPSYPYAYKDTNHSFGTART